MSLKNNDACRKSSLSFSVFFVIQAIKRKTTPKAKKQFTALPHLMLVPTDRDQHTTTTEKQNEAIEPTDENEEMLILMWFGIPVFL